MSYNQDLSESFYRSHARRYAEVSHNFIQPVYTDSSHPGLKGDTGPRGPSAGACAAGI